MLDLLIRLQDSCLSRIKGLVEEGECQHDKGSLLIISSSPQNLPEGTFHAIMAQGSRHLPLLPW